MPHWKRMLTGLTSAFLMLSLTACSVPQKLLPPDSLLEDCPHALTPEARTNAALARFAYGEWFALESCNTDKAALRKWRDSQ